MQIYKQYKNNNTMKHIKLFEAFVASKLNENDPHGTVEAGLIAFRQGGLKLVSHTDDKGYSGYICAEGDKEDLVKFLLAGFDGDLSKIEDASALLADVASEADAETDAMEAKWEPVTKFLKCKFDDLVFLDLLTREADFYSQEEYDFAAETLSNAKANTKEVKLAGF